VLVLCPRMAREMAAKRPERALDFASHNSFAPASRPAKLTQSIKAKIFVA